MSSFHAERFLSWLRSGLATGLSTGLIASACLAIPQAQTRAGGNPQRGTGPGVPAGGSRLRDEIDSITSAKEFAKAEWGIAVESVASGQTLYEKNPDKFLVPASNAKLFTAAMALDMLGPDFRIQTSVYSSARPGRRGVLNSDLIVYGRGDPGLKCAEQGGDCVAPLEPLVSQLVRAGVRRINGDLIGDESYFRGSRYGSGWDWDSLQWYYGAGASALSINDNAVQLQVRPGSQGSACVARLTPGTSAIEVVNNTKTVAPGQPRTLTIYRAVGGKVVYISGSMPLGDTGFDGALAVPDPAMFFLEMFKRALGIHGILVKGRLRTMDWTSRQSNPFQPDRLRCLASLESAPLAQIVKETLKRSQNLYAQLLLLQAGVHWEEGVDQSGPPPATTEEAGLRAMDSLANAAGIQAGVMMEEGSGLSRRDLVTASSLVGLLAFMAKHRFASIFSDCLPVAGVDGTLTNRLKDSAAQYNVKAKTGTLKYVSALSGYVTNVAGDRLAFSVILNNYYSAESARSGRDAIDRIVSLLAASGKNQASD